MHVSSSSAIVTEASSATVDTIFEYRNSCCASCETRDCPAGRLEWELVRSANFAPHQGPHQLRTGQVNCSEEGVDLLLQLALPFNSSTHLANQVLDGLVDFVQDWPRKRLIVPTGAVASGGEVRAGLCQVRTDLLQCFLGRSQLAPDADQFCRRAVGLDLDVFGVAGRQKAPDGQLDAGVNRPVVHEGLNGLLRGDRRPCCVSACPQCCGRLTGGVLGVGAGLEGQHLVRVVEQLIRLLEEGELLAGREGGEACGELIAARFDLVGHGLLALGGIEHVDVLSVGCVVEKYSIVYMKFSSTQ